MQLWRFSRKFWTYQLFSAFVMSSIRLWPQRFFTSKIPHQLAHVEAAQWNCYCDMFILSDDVMFVHLLDLLLFRVLIYHACVSLELIYHACASLELIYPVCVSLELIYHACVPLELIYHACVSLELIYHVCVSLEVIYYDCVSLEPHHCVMRWKCSNASSVIVLILVYCFSFSVYTQVIEILQNFVAYICPSKICMVDPLDLFSCKTTVYWSEFTL